MSNLKDPNEQYYIIQEHVVDLLIKYDEHVRDHHKNLIQVAENMVKNTPLKVPERKPDEPMKYHRYMTSPIFANTVKAITGYIISNIRK